MNEPFQLRLLRLQADLHTRLRGIREARKVLVYALRATKEAFGAQEAAIAALRPDQAGASLLFTIPPKGTWDSEWLTQYLTTTGLHIPSHTLLAPIERRGRTWAVLALRGESEPFTKEHRKALFWITQILTDVIQVLDRNRTREVRRRIERKIANREEPKDLMYHILDGLRSLTH